MADRTRQLEQAFEGILQAFQPERAGTKSFNLFFEIEGHPGHSLILKNGTLSAHGGRVGKSTADVKTDVDTLIGIFEGTLSAEMAFVAGKLIPSNPMEVLLLTQVVDLNRDAPSPRAAAQTKPPPKASPSTSASPALTACVAALPQTFNASKAQGWTHRIYLSIEGNTGFTLLIEDNKAQVEGGKGEDIWATLHFTCEKIAVALLTGQMNAQQAFMAGKFTASNLGVMIKFTQFFSFQRPLPQKVSPMSQRTNLIGKTYPTWQAKASESAMKSYAKAVGEDNPAYLGDNCVGHPIFPVVYTLKGMQDAWNDDTLNLDTLRLVHGEQDMRLLAPIHPGDTLTWEAKLHNIEEKRRGTLVELKIHATRDDETVVETRTTLFVRSRGPNPLAPPPSDSDKKRPKKTPPSRGKIVVSHTAEVTEDLPKRYAEASGDHNPIHLDDAVAQKAGLPGVILQGLCSMAMATKGFVDQAADGDPTRLTRFSLRFAKPVLPGNHLTTEGWILEKTDTKTVYAFEVKNEDDVAVIVNGRAEIQHK